VERERVRERRDRGAESVHGESDTAIARPSVGEIQAADPRSRRLAVTIVGCAAAAGALLIIVAQQFRPEFEAWLQQDLRARFRLVIAALTIATTGPVLALAAYSWDLGRRIVRAGRFPPPALRLIRDTPVVTGEAARRRGRLIQWFAAALGLAAVFLAVFLWRLTSLLR